MVNKERLVERRVARIERDGHRLAAQLGGVFRVDPRKLSDFRARALSTPSMKDEDDD